MADEDQITVAIDPEVVESDKDKETVVKTGDAAVDDLADQFKELQGQAERDRAGRVAAERREAAQRAETDKARREVAEARSEVADSQLSTFESGIAAAQAESEAAKRDIQAFGEAGEMAKQAEAYERLADARARIGRFNEAKADIEARKATEPVKQPERTEQVTAPADPIEAYIQGRTEPTANWLRKHAEFITDPKKNAKLTSAHWAAVAEGLAPDTDDYFSHVETTIGLRKVEAAPATNGAAKPARKALAPAAPVTSSGGGTSGGGTEVRLSAGEARAAQDGTHVWNYDDTSSQKRFKKGDPIGVQEFAKRKLAMTKQGLYDRSFVES